MNLKEQIMGILKAFPGRAIVLTSDGTSFRAGLLARSPNLGDFAASDVSECRSLPDDAVDRLHEKLVAVAEQCCRGTQTHLARLTGRPDPTELPGGEPK